MEWDFELITILVTLGMWGFIIFLVWGISMGFEGTKEKIVLTVASLPIIYAIVLINKNR